MTNFMTDSIMDNFFTFNETIFSVSFLSLSHTPIIFKLSVGLYIFLESIFKKKKDETQLSDL